MSIQTEDRVIAEEGLDDRVPAEASGRVLRVDEETVLVDWDDSEGRHPPRHKHLDGEVVEIPSKAWWIPRDQLKISN